MSLTYQWDEGTRHSGLLSMTPSNLSNKIWTRIQLLDNPWKTHKNDIVRAVRNNYLPNLMFMISIKKNAGNYLSHVRQKAIFVFPVLDWSELANEANAGSSFKCKWHLFLFNLFPTWASIASYFQSNTEKTKIAYKNKSLHLARKYARIFIRRTVFSDIVQG